MARPRPHDADLKVAKLGAATHRFHSSSWHRDGKGNILHAQIRKGKLRVATVRTVPSFAQQEGT